LAFANGLATMVLELVAGRLVGRYVGSSLIVWTSVIGVILGGIGLGNVLGGRLVDRAGPGPVLGPLFALAAALMVACVWINALVGLVPGPDGLPWAALTVLIVVLDFLPPATALGMIGPVVAGVAV
jgi:hypothetical protein